MMYNQFGAPQMNYGNYGYGMPQPQTQETKFHNVLTPDQINRLTAKVNQFSLAMTDEERLRGICNHRNKEGTSDTLVQDPITGEYTCQICGYRFRPVDPNLTTDEIQEAVNTIVDILQTVKLMYTDLPADAAADYFQIIPLIEKIPQLFEFAGKTMSKYSLNDQYAGRNMGTMQMFNNLNALFGGGMGFQQPAYQQPAGYPQQAGFGYPGASAGYMPGTTGFQYTPQYNEDKVPATFNPVAAAQPIGNPAAMPPVGNPVAAPQAPAVDQATVSQTVTV